MNLEHALEIKWTRLTDRLNMEDEERGDSGQTPRLIR